MASTSRVAETTTKASSTAGSSTCTSCSRTASDTLSEEVTTALPLLFHRPPWMRAPSPLKAVSAYLGAQMRHAVTRAKKPRT